MSMELFNNEAESLTLAGFIRYAEEYWSLNDIGLARDDFMGTENRRVMRAIEQVTADRSDPDVPNLVEVLRVGDHTSTIDYIGKLVTLPVSQAQVREYSKTVKGLSVSRQLVLVGTQIVSVAQEKRADADSAVAEAESLLRKVALTIPKPDNSPDPLDIIRRMKARGPMASVPIRFSETLQDMTSGLVPGELWVIGGYSSTGKSAVACNIVNDVMHERDKWAMVVSAEMTQEQYMVRLLSLRSGVAQKVIRERLPLSMESTQALRQAEVDVARANLRVHFLTRIGSILSAAKRQKETEGLDVLVVDFLQNLRGESGDFAFQDMTGIILDFQQLAKELNCTVIVFSQVSNEQAKWDAEGGDSNVYSFKGSGAIKDAADVGIMLKRDRARQSPVLDFHMVKNRNGEMRVIPCLMTLETGRIREDYADG